MIRRLLIENLTLARGGRTLFAGLDAALGQGQALALTGANGAGKTSLLRAVAGLLPPEAGAVAFEGEEGPLEAEAARAGSLHLLGHHDGLKTNRTAREELTFWSRWSGAAPDGVDRAVEAMSLAPLLDLDVRKLSAGQRRRLALARLIAAPRPLWLLDEPMAPLDAAHRAAFGELMQAHLLGGGMILAAVHDPLPVKVRTLDISSPPLRGRGQGEGGVGGTLADVARPPPPLTPPRKGEGRALFRRELALAWGRGGGVLYPGAFYAGLSTLLPLAAGSEPQRLAALAPGVAFAALALSNLLSLERLFERDYEDGALDLLVLGAPPLEAVCLVKGLAQFVAVGAPLALLAPVIAIALGAAPTLAPLIVATALLGGLGFAFTGGIGAALALGTRRGGLLIAVIVLPLFTPPVIFGAGAVQALASGLPWSPGLIFLAAYSLAAAALSPFAMAAAVRNAVA